MERSLKQFFVLLLAILLIISILLYIVPFQTPVFQNEKYHKVTAKVRLRFTSNWSSHERRSYVLGDIINKFIQDNPDVEVVNESMSGDYFLTKLMIDFASCNEPDVFYLWPGSDIRTLIKANKVAELDTILQEDKDWKKSFYGDSWTYMSHNGKIYGLPFESFFQGLFINRDLFEKYNVPIPQNFDELKYAVLAFRNERIIPITYSSESDGSLLYQNLVARLGGREEVEHPLIKGRISRSYIEAMNYIKELYQLGAFPWEAFILDSDGSKELFIDKKAAMIMQGSGFIGQFLDKDDSVDIIPFPYIEHGKADPSAVVYGQGWGSLHMSRAAWSDTGRKKASVRLMKALTSEESGVKFVEHSGMLLNIHLPQTGVKHSRLSMKIQKYVLESKELIGPPDSFIDRPVWEEYIIKQLPYVLDRNKNGHTIEPQDVWREAEKQLVMD